MASPRHALNPPSGKAGKDGRSGRIRTCDPRVPNAVLYQTEPHSDLGGRLIEAIVQDRKRVRKTFFGALHPANCWAISTPSPRGTRSSEPFLLGNGVMVTLRFLVPSF